MERVDTGNTLVTDAGATMKDIVSQVRGISTLIGEITAAGSHQNSAIGNVNNTVMQLDRMTQQNAALVEQAAAAAESLKLQAFKLADTVAIFKLNG